MKSLLKHHGFKLTGVKPDLYTAIGTILYLLQGSLMNILLGLDSKHKSGISSTVSICLQGIDCIVDKIQVWKGSGAGLLKEKEVEVSRECYGHFQPLNASIGTPQRILC